MMKAVTRPTIVLLEKIHPSADANFADSGVDVRRIDRGLSEEELIAALKGLPDGPKMLGIRSKTRVTPRVIEAVPDLMAIGCFCIGTDQVALTEARTRGLAVFNAPFSNTRSVAELVLGEIIMLSRQVFARSQGCHAGAWNKSAVGSHEVRGKVLGIVGYGHIGSQLSVLAEALGMRVCYHDIVQRLPLGNASTRASLGDVLSESDFVTMHVPDTELTRNMMGAEQFAVMKRGSYFINASRGNVADIGALRAALDEGHLAGAAIDVFPKEPASDSESFVSELRGLSSVILTPHIGGSTQEAQENIGREVSDALVRYWHKGTTTGSVNFPPIDVPAPSDSAASCRILNVHRNVPGVLSRVNAIVAGLEFNIVGVALGTQEDIGVLVMDVSVPPASAAAQGLRDAVAALPTSIRTRLLCSV